MSTKVKNPVTSQTIELLHFNHKILETFYLGGDNGEPGLDDLEKAINYAANTDVWKEACVHIEALKKLTGYAMDAASNSARQIAREQNNQTLTFNRNA